MKVGGESELICCQVSFTVKGIRGGPKENCRNAHSNTLRLVSKTSAALAYVSGQKYKYFFSVGGGRWSA